MTGRFKEGEETGMSSESGVTEEGAIDPTSVFGNLKHCIMTTLQHRLAQLGKCPICRGRLEVIPVAGHPEFAPRQCEKCRRIIFV